jgi:superoxide dismutase, Cu-Zn family
VFRGVAFVALVLSACGSEPDPVAPNDPFAREPPEPGPLLPVKRAIAEFVAPDDPNLSGSITFQQLPPDGVRTDAVISGLEPSERHGLHLHEAMECDELAAGSPHFDGVSGEGESPRRHADPIQIDAHLGDLGNAQADEHGDAMLTSVVRPLLTIDDGGRFDIVGRVVVLHRGEDDFTSDSPDNSGGLLACGKVALLPAE